MTFNEAYQKIMSFPDYQVEIKDAVILSTHFTAQIAKDRIDHFVSTNRNPAEDLQCRHYKAFLVKSIEQIEAGKTKEPRNAFI